MYGGNCSKCTGGVRLSKEDFIQKAKVVHGDKYDYEKVIYKNYSTKVEIICKEHGVFWQTPNNHLFGAGCPACPQSNLEGELRQFLIKNQIEFEQEKTFSWLKCKRKMYLDFYLPVLMLLLNVKAGNISFLSHYLEEKIFSTKHF